MATMELGKKELKRARRAIFSFIDEASLCSLASIAKGSCTSTNAPEPQAASRSTPLMPARTRCWQSLIQPDARQLHPASRRRMRKRRRDDAPPGRTPRGDAQAASSRKACMFWIARKQRYCSMQRLSNSSYCGVHADASLSLSARTAEGAVDEGAAPAAARKERVPCPIDPSHTVYRHNLKAHVRICTRAKQDLATQALPYFSRGINSGVNTTAPAPPETAPAAIAAAPRTSAFLQADKCPLTVAPPPEDRARGGHH